jgi:4-carboxymuconolactone decarboxylase
MTEAVHVACAIRGGASLVHGVQMRNVVNQLSM